MNAPVVMPDRLKATPHVGPVDWRRMVQWLSDDKVISHEEAQRTIARCSQAESAQHALVRLANVAMARASDGKPLDIETLTEYLAQRAGLGGDQGRVGERACTYFRRVKRELGLNLLIIMIILFCMCSFVRGTTANKDMKCL